MSEKNWQDLPQGIVNLEAGNSLKNVTSRFRRGEKPEFNPDTCINCFFCWVFCPENAIIVENDNVVGVNYDYCKGCGICANECPVKKEPKPIVMVEENQD